MKNLLAFLIIWLAVAGIWGWFGEANRSEVKAVFRALGIGLLTATITCVTLGVIVVLF